SLSGLQCAKSGNKGVFVIGVKEGYSPIYNFSAVKPKGTQHTLEKDSQLPSETIPLKLCHQPNSSTDWDPLREARQLDEGVCTSNTGCSTEPNSTLAPPQCDLVFSSLFPVSAGQPFSLQEIWTDTKIVEAICKTGPQDQDTFLLDSVKSSASRSLNPNLSRLLSILL
ncbi:uncharacterized protein VP01_6947g1, partial [Puccinia sorghi]